MESARSCPKSIPTLHYISNSASGVVSGGGPYAAQTAKFYFTNRATPKLHSELGMPNIVTFDSLRQMMPESALWPQGLEWGLHDFNLTSAQRLSGFRAMIDKSYGGADNAADWVRLAQFINYDGYRAIFEAQSKNRMGILLWMSHPCWPSFVWQTYDYYFDPTAGYFGSKKGSEPLHIQWNAATDNIEVVNYSAGACSGSDGARRAAEHRRIRQVGEIGGRGQPGRQRGRAHRDGIPRRPLSGALHQAEAAARRRDRVGELLLARRRGRQLPGAPGTPEGEAGQRTPASNGRAAAGS